MYTIQQNFTFPLLKWYKTHGRHDLPWQHPRSPYRVWISEIMLQQTQVKTVIPYFLRFMERFPTIQALAIAPEDDVLAHWSGLGYYSRARNLHKTAKILCEQFQNEFPKTLKLLISLPGIGPSTAAAIASLAFNQPTAILDGNVKRVLSRYFMIDGSPSQTTVNAKLWALANECMPSEQCTEYTQAIMDLGATCCTIKKTNCLACPLQSTCLSNANDVVAQYPHKTIKKKLPTKEEQFLLLHTEHNLIYLEKRPPTGLWGGLWCLPTTTIDTCAMRHVKEQFKFDCEQPNELIKIKHSFSHFHLHIKALSLQVNTSIHGIAENAGRWFQTNELDRLGLATPVRTIIDHFIKSS